jgi:hypothetical protein
MAKNSDANPLEGHIEKIVLGVCALVLIYVVAHWVTSSPQTVEVIDPANLTSTKLVPPDKADAELREASARIRKKNMEANVAPLPNILWEAQFAEASGRPFPPVAALDDGTPSVPIRVATPRDSNALPRLAELAAMVQPPEKPTGWSGMEVRQPAVEEAVFHGICLYPWGDLKKSWEEKRNRLPNSIVVLRVEVQSQTRSLDGQYPPGEGTPARLASLPPLDSQGQALPMPVIPDFDGNNAPAVRTAVAELASPRWQRYILEPPYFNIFGPRGGWVSPNIHLPDNRVSDMDLATTTSAPATAPSGGPVSPSAAGASSTVGPVPPEALSAPGARSIPDLARQQDAGTVLITFHDNTLTLGTASRYRVRVVFVNPLLSQEAVFNRATDSFPKEIASPWSEWSEDVIIENPTHFFLTGKTPNGSNLQMTVFTQKMGQTVQKTFDVEPGMAVGGPAQVPVRIKGGALTPVDFSTGCVAVAVDMERKFMQRTAGGGSLEITTAAMTYLDEKGRLKTKVLAEDVKSPEYLKLKAEAGVAP